MQMPLPQEYHIVRYKCPPLINVPSIYFTKTSTSTIFHQYTCSIFPPKNTLFFPQIYMKCHTEAVYIGKELFYTKKSHIFGPTFPCNL